MATPTVVVPSTVAVIIVALTTPGTTVAAPNRATGFTLAGASPTALPGVPFAVTPAAGAPGAASIALSAIVVVRPASTVTVTLRPIVVGTEATGPGIVAGFRAVT
ncbi:hypothetical protein M0E84_00005 [Corynebacterium sp. CCM 9186]|uniref:hypothetical protein n=1 Tax=Corynebacterium meridianum TaxID=2765363 RepID=UPI002005BE58|nr:hypothetical protein [Corynebacterium meridianum]MCK7676433.1 hypothetical protein [Corynebacterium meridianum]